MSEINGGPKKMNVVNVKMTPELKSLVGKAADKENLSMYEWIVGVIADRLGRPELGKVQRRRAGRPRQEMAVSP